MRRRLKRFDLTDVVARGIVMDRHAWSYTLAAEEMVREGKIDERAAAGSGRIPGRAPLRARRSLHRARERGGHLFGPRDGSTATARWYDADRGLPAFSIVRSGCFRGAVPLPTGAGRAGRDSLSRLLDFRLVQLSGRASAIRARFAAPRQQGLHCRRALSAAASVFHWTGRVPSPIDGDWREFPIP